MKAVLFAFLAVYSSSYLTGPCLAQDTAATPPLNQTQTKPDNEGSQAPIPTKHAAVRLGAVKDSFPNSTVLPSAAESNSDANSGPDKNKPAKTITKNELIIAPIPFSNQAFSFGLTPMVEYVFSLDKHSSDSPPSSLMLGGLIAQRSSWGLGGGGRFYPFHDRFRITAFGAHGSISYKVFGSGNAGGSAGLSVLIHQGGNFVATEFLIRTVSKLYFGPRYNYRNLTAGLDSRDSPVPLPPGLNGSDLGVKFDARGPGFKILFDTRANEFFPTAGDELQLVGDFFGATRSSTVQAFNAQLHYQTYQASENHYFSLAPRAILAMRGMLCAVNGDAPFYELCQFGSFGDVRGYEPGRFRDHRMFAVQAEYRQILTRHWGASAFAGVGEVAPSWGAFNTSNLLPGGGVGGRFNLGKEDRINLRADIAYGKVGWSWVFSLGEAF